FHKSLLPPTGFGVRLSPAALESMGLCAQKEVHSSCIHALSCSIPCGKFSRNQRATSAGSSPGSVAAISQRKLSLAPSCGSGLKVIGKSLLEQRVLSSRPSW